MVELKSGIMRRAPKLFLGGFMLAVASFAPLPAQSCDSCAAAVQLPINTGLQVAQITATTAAVVAAIGTNGGGNGGATEGAAAASFEAQKSAAGMVNSGTMVGAYREANVASVINPQSLNCRLSTANRVAAATQSISRGVSKNLERGVVDNTFFNANLTPQRIAVASLYRLCQNGQLAPEDFGQAWWTANGCFSDPTTVHDFLKISTILDSPVLIPPSQAQMDILNNPESYAAGTASNVWNNQLNDKQKKYVGAQRYCENLVASRMRPQNIRNDAAMTAGNMTAISMNFGAASAVASVSNMCSREMARRVALDTASLPAGPYRQELEDNGPKMINLLVNMRGADPRALYAYATPADYTANSPIAGAAGPKPWISEYVKGMVAEAHGLSDKCAGWGNSTSSAATTGTFLECNMMVAQYERNEAANKKAFIEAVAAIDQSPNFVDAAGSAAVKINHEGQPARPMLQDASLEVPGFDQQPMRLDEMLHTMNAAQNPEKTAAASASDMQ